MIWSPVVGAIALAAGGLFERIVLMKRKISIKDYQVAHFFAIFLATIPFIFFFWEVKSSAFELWKILVFIAIILVSIGANLFVFYSMKWEKLSRLEPAKMIEPLVVIILAILFSFIFGEELYERNTKIFIPALVAGLALIGSHIQKHHLSFNKYFLSAMAGSFLFALELVLSRLLLDDYSPVSFYFIRVCGVLILSFLIFRPSLKFSNRVKFEIFLTGAVWTLYRIIVYYGYLNLGVIFTTLLVMLGPVFVYFFAWKFLKEKLSWRNILATAIILGSVVYAVWG